MSEVLFPFWQIDRDEYAAVCRYLGLTPREPLYERLESYLVTLPFSTVVPSGFARYLAKPRLNRFRIARLDLATKLLFPAHPARHVLNAVIALHECEGRGFRELATSPTGIAVWPALAASAARLALNVLLTSVWLTGETAAYASGRIFRRGADLRGKRVLITGVSRGLGLDLLLHCLESGATVVGTVRSDESRNELAARLSRTAPLRLIVADLSRPGDLAAALQDAEVSAHSIDIAIACAGVKHAGSTALSLRELRHTFEVNLFAPAELAHWLCSEPGAERAGDRPRALVLVSSMGRWHGMHGSGGYNASKAALSIWGESLEMDLRRAGRGDLTVTVVEPGLFASGMVRRGGLNWWLFAPRRDVAEAIVTGAVRGRHTMRPPFWFALLTWGVCLAGRSVRARLFGRVKSEAD